MVTRWTFFRKSSSLQLKKLTNIHIKHVLKKNLKKNDFCDFASYISIDPQNSYKLAWKWPYFLHNIWLKWLKFMIFVIISMFSMLRNVLELYMRLSDQQGCQIWPTGRGCHIVFPITIDCHWYWSLVCLICSTFWWQRIKYKYFWNCIINRVARYALHYCQVYETGLPDKLFSINFCFQWLGNIIQFINATIQFQWQLIKFK